MSIAAADLHDQTFVHDRDPIGHDQGLLLVVGNEDEGDPEAGLEMLELELHALPKLKIKRTKWLVEQQHLAAD